MRRLARGRGRNAGSALSFRGSRFVKRIRRIMRGAKPSKSIQQHVVITGLRPYGAPTTTQNSNTFDPTTNASLKFDPRFNMAVGPNPQNISMEYALLSDRVYIKGIKVNLNIESSDYLGDVVSTQENAWRFQILQTLGNQSATVNSDVTGQWMIPNTTQTNVWSPPLNYGQNWNLNNVLTIARNSAWDKRYNRVLDTGWKHIRPVQRPGGDTPYYSNNLPETVNTGPYQAYEFPYKHYEWWIPINKTYELNNNGTINGWQSWNMCLFGTFQQGFQPQYSICNAVYYCDGGAG